MKSGEAQQRLLTVLKERNINIGPDDVAWAFESPRTRDEVTVWIEEYLDSLTLLTEDEYELYNAIGYSRAQAELAAATSGTRALSDSDLKAAIESLTKSTNAIEKHAKALEVQKEALLALKAQELDASAYSPTRQSQELENNRLEFALEDMRSSTEELLVEAEKQTQRSIAQLSSVSNERMSADNQVLDAISKLAPKALAADSDQLTPETVEKMCQALVELREQEAKARMDATLQVLLSEYASKTAEDADKDEGAAERDELQTEFNTLREEIGSVVRMVVGHELREPLIDIIRRSADQAAASRRNWFDYITSTFEHMVGQLESTNAQATELLEYDSALREIRTAFKTTATEIPLVPGKPGADSAPNTPLRGLSLKPKARDEKLAGGTVHQVLRRFDVGSGAGYDVEEAKAELAKVATEAISKLQAQYASAEAVTLEAISNSLEENKRHLDAILARIYSNSKYGTIRLTDQGLESELQELDQSVAQLAEALEKAPIEKQAAQIQVGKLKAKWG
ncbi:hypothetical protein EJ06DRAFT_579457 [Trichodelitschia bisporula]|uniref:HAUS augmin-like complex subunit 3 N-terminal domain-containing protein n=1 Tax=Trichodelitschia bisporula TaxID=703511 RepID=A0A6G1I567_9PEZI|nr:hypothetical protein EJ06DRAFT_579457 [Trichodelitschia bisporula]